MKLVTGVRHAKSDWSTGLPDIERPLNKRGRRDGPRMGLRLTRLEFKPDLLITSPAVRTLTTANLVAAELAYPRDAILVVDELYGARPSTILDVLADLPAKSTHVMFFSHNPGITDFVNRVARAGIDNIPTCGVAQLEFAINDWFGVHAMEARLVAFDYPKRIDESGT